MGTVEALLTPSAQDKPRARPALPGNTLEQDTEDAGKGARGPSGDWQGPPGGSQGPVWGCSPCEGPGQLTEDSPVGVPPRALSPASLTGQHPSLGSKGPGPNTS